MADLDGSGALSKAEVAKCFCRQVRGMLDNKSRTSARNRLLEPPCGHKEVTEKLVSLQLSVPDWSLSLDRRVVTS